MKFSSILLIFGLFVTIVSNAIAMAPMDVSNIILSDKQNQYFDIYLGESTVAKLNGNLSQSYVEKVDVYHQDILDLKKALKEMLSKLHAELSSKKYPQEYFIKSIMSQVEEKKFNSLNDFDVTKQIIDELRQSVDSQSKANKRLDHIIMSDSDYLLKKLDKLKVDFQEISIPKGLNEYTKESKKQVTNKDTPVGKWLSLVGNSLVTSMGLVFEMVGEVGRLVFSGIFKHLVLFLGFGMFVMTAATFFLSRKSFLLSAENKKLKNKDWKNVIAVKAKKELRTTLDSLENISICQVDDKDKIVFTNKTFEKKFGKQLDWPSFFSDNFKVDKNLKGGSEFYKFKGDIGNDYFVSVGERDARGGRLIFVHWINSLTLTRLAENRKSILEENKLNVLDLLENSISKQSSFRSEGKIKFAETDYAESLSLYLSEAVGQKIIDHFIKSISSIVRIKNCSKEVEIKPVRSDKKLFLIAFIPEINLNSKDLTTTVPFSGKMISLGNALKSVGNLAEGHEVSFVVKNIDSSVKKGTQVELVISDLEKININSFEYTL